MAVKLLAATRRLGNCLCRFCLNQHFVRMGFSTSELAILAVVLLATAVYYFAFAGKKTTPAASKGSGTATPTIESSTGRDFVAAMEKAVSRCVATLLPIDGLPFSAPLPARCPPALSRDDYDRNGASWSDPQRRADGLSRSQKKKIVIFYGSQTGTAEDYATKIAKEAKARYGLSSLVCDPEECVAHFRFVLRNAID